MIVSREPILDLRVFLNPDRGLPYPFNERPTHFYAYGRVALLAGLKLLRLKEGDNVLIPSYICNVVMAPFNYLKIGVKFFEVDRELKPRLDQVQDLIDERTRAILAVNYFGFPTLLSEIRALCQQKKLFFIEDNAHGLFSRFGNTPLGTFGHIGIFSQRKTLGLPDGAALVLNRNNLSADHGLTLKPSAGETMFFLRHLNRNLEMFFGINLVQSLKRLMGIKTAVLPLGESPEEESNIEKYFFRQSRWSNFILRRTEIATITAIRRSAFRYWLKHLPDGEPLFSELSEGVVPYAFPVLTPDPQAFIKLMLQKGVECFPWPTLPSPVKDFPDFYKKIVLIPVWKTHES